MYKRNLDDSGVYSNNPEYAEAPEVEEVFRCACGIDLEFPARWTLPRDLAIRAAEEFFVTGELPRFVSWVMEY